MLRPCPISIFCEPDEVSGNYTSENNDGTVFKFTAIAFPKPNPYDPIHPPWLENGSWTSTACAGAYVCVSTVSQEAADDCAESFQVNCIEKPKDNPKDPVCVNDPLNCIPPNPIPVFNDEQSCSFYCPDRYSFVWTIAAGIIQALNKATANALAKALACQRVVEHWVCATPISGMACVDTPFVGTIIAGGPDSPFSFKMISGSLPPEIIMQQVSPVTLQFSGTCTTTGNYPFTLEITSSYGIKIYRNYTFSVLGITNVSLPDGSPGTFYSVNLTANGGSAPYTYEITEGVLPDGLGFSTDGLIEGTPTTVEIQLIKVKVTEGSSAHRSCVKELTISIVESCWVYLASPLFPADIIASGGTGAVNFGGLTVFKNKTLNPQFFDSYVLVCPDGGGFGYDMAGVWNYHAFDGADTVVGPGIIADQLNIYGTSDTGSAGMIYNVGAALQIELWTPGIGTRVTVLSAFVRLSNYCVGPNDHFLYAMFDGVINFDLWMWYPSIGHVALPGSTNQGLAHQSVASTGHAAMAMRQGTAHRTAFFWNGVTTIEIYNPGSHVNVVSCNASDIVSGLVTTSSFFTWNPTDGLTILGLPPGAVSGDYTWVTDDGVIIVNANNGSWYYHNGSWGPVSDLLDPAELWTHVDYITALSHDGYAVGVGTRDAVPTQFFWCKLCAPPP